MAAVTDIITSFDNHGVNCDITMTYDDQTLKVTSIDCQNDGPQTQIEITINGNHLSHTVKVGANSYVPPGAGITLLPPVKPGGSPRVPFDVSVATP